MAGDRLVAVPRPHQCKNLELPTLAAGCLHAISLPLLCPVPAPRVAWAAGKHIEIKDLPQCDRFSALRSEKKHFIDTLKLIACRAETAMAGLAREHMARHDDARSLLRQLYESAVDLQPDQENKTLTVRLHHLSARGHDTVIARLCEDLTATETVFPGTDLRLIFQFVGSS
jgi:hypothetical protein